MVSEPLIFECPVDPKVRVFLRYEYLQKAVQNLMAYKNLELETIKALQELSSLVANNNIKNTLLVALQDQADSLQKYSEIEKADRGKIFQQLNALVEARKQVNEFSTSRVDEEHHLREAIRRRSSVASGTCSFDLPAFYSWLHTSQYEKDRDVRTWYEPFKKLDVGICSSLSLTRLSGFFETARTEKGRFRKVLSEKNSPSMLRLKMQKRHALFPEFSVGKHQLYLYFMQVSNFARQPRISDHDFEFQLAMCVL